MFGEHGKWAHHNSLYEEVLRVPFIVRYDGVVPVNAVIDAPVSTIDIPPTVLGLLGMSATGFEGVSLAEGLRGETVLPTDRPIFSDADAIIDPNIPPYWQAPHSELRAVRQGDWKYVYGFDDTTQELYQLQPDSIYEADDLFSSHPDQAHMMYTYLDSRFFLPTNYLYLPCLQR